MWVSFANVWILIHVKKSLLLLLLLSSSLLLVLLCWFIFVSWWFDSDRKEAELMLLLPGNSNGTFLVREAHGQYTNTPVKQQQQQRRRRQQWRLRFKFQISFTFFSSIVQVNMFSNYVELMMIFYLRKKTFTEEYACSQRKNCGEGKKKSIRLYTRRSKKKAY